MKIEGRVCIQVAVDIDNDLRDAWPDLGADEFPNHVLELFLPLLLK